MILSQLSVRFFRNFPECQLGFCPGANWILGGNGHGKTNLLEAIHVLALSRSFRTHQSRDLIQWESDQSYVWGKVRSRDRENELSIEQKALSRRYCVNRSRVDLLEYVGRLSVVVFSTAQVEQFKSGDASRRRLIDRGIYPLQPAHLKRVLDYTRVIRQKNSLLREGPSGYNNRSRDLLDSWNLQIAVLGAKIIKSRQGYIEKVRSKLLLHNNRFTPENLTLNYVASSGVDASVSLPQIKEQLMATLNNARESEFRVRKAVVGPHRDSISMEVDGRCMQRFGSAGQQRSSLIAYQLAQMEVHFDLRGEYPLFLMDDLDAELDEQRIDRLLQVLGAKAQLFITTNKPGFIRSRSTAFTSDRGSKVFQVESGHFAEMTAVHETFPREKA